MAGTPEQPQIVGTSFQGRVATAPERGLVSENGTGPSESQSLPTQEVRAEAPPILPMGAGLEDISKAVGDYGMQQAQAQQQTWLMSQGSQYDLQAHSILQNAQRNAQPGQEIGPTVNDALTKLRTNSLTGIDNPTLAAAYQDRMMASQQQIMGHAAEYDFNERDRFTKFNVVNGYQTMAKNVGMATKYEDAGDMGTEYLGELGHTLDQTPMLPADKQSLLMEGRGVIGEAVNKQQINIDRDRWIAEHSAAFPSEMRAMVDLPRGIRNNNPGNLESGSFQGATGADKDGYLTFDKPENGLRALALNLKNQQDIHGLNTVQDIITKYAPPTENNTGAYIDDVSRQLGVQPDQKINLHDADTLTHFTSAVVSHENNRAQPFAPETMDWAVKSALGESGPAPQSQQTADGGARTGNLAFNVMTYPEQQKLVTYAYTEMKRARSEAAFYGTMANSDIDGIEKATEQGLAVPDSLIQSATAKVQAAPTPALQARLQGAQDKIQTSTAMWKMTPTDAQTYVSGLEKQATSQGATAQIMENYIFAQKVLGNMDASIKKDPLGTFEKSGGQVPQLDFNNPDTIRQRGAVANTVAQTYGVSPASAFFRQEDRARITNMLNKATPSQTLSLLGTLHQNIDEPLYQGVMAQLRPNSPVTALAGSYVGLGRSLTTPGGLFGSDTTVKPEDVANNMLIGESILNPSKADKSEEGRGKNFPMPKDEDFRRSMPSDYNDIFRGLPQQQADMIQGVKSYYAALMSQKGDYSGNIDTKVLQKSYHDVLGNATNPNGRGAVLAPWGMSGAEFNDQLAAAYNEQAKAAGIDTDKFPFKSVGFENRGTMGQYRVTSGSGYIVDKKGAPVVIDLTPQGPKP